MTFKKKILYFSKTMLVSILPKKVSEWLEDNNITVLRWYPHSPDLNPIENL
jgi:transposase